MKCRLTGVDLPVYEGTAGDDLLATEELPPGGFEIIIIRRRANPDSAALADALAWEEALMAASLQGELQVEEDAAKTRAHFATVAKYYPLLKDTPGVIDDVERVFIHPNAPTEGIIKLGKVLRSRLLRGAAALTD